MYLDITKVVLMFCDIVENIYQHDFRVLYKFVPIKSLSQLLDISTTKNVFLKFFNSNF